MPRRRKKAATLRVEAPRCECVTIIQKQIDAEKVQHGQQQYLKEEQLREKTLASKLNSVLVQMTQYFSLWQSL